MESGFLQKVLRLITLMEERMGTVSILVLMESGFLPVLTFGIAFATIIAHVFII